MFWFQLAAHLGMSVKRAQTEIDSREFAEWLAFSRIEPIGAIRGDLQAASISQTIAAYNTAKGAVPALQNFLLRFEPNAATDSDTMEAKFRALMKSRIKE